MRARAPCRPRATRRCPASSSSSRLRRPLGPSPSVSQRRNAWRYGHPGTDQGSRDPRSREIFSRIGSRQGPRGPRALG
eukprot:5545950-Pyramimonas_sp.AAC.1